MVRFCSLEGKVLQILSGGLDLAEGTTFVTREAVSYSHLPDARRCAAGLPVHDSKRKEKQIMLSKRNHAHANGHSTAKDIEISHADANFCPSGAPD